MTDLDIYLAVLTKIVRENWFVIIYIVGGLAVLRRREKLEKERMAEIIARDKLKRINNQEYSSSRY